MDEFLKSIDGKGSALRSAEYYSDIAATLKKLGLNPLSLSHLLKVNFIRFIKRAHLIAIILRRKGGSAGTCEQHRGSQSLKIDEPTTEPSDMEPNRRQGK